MSYSIFFDQSVLVRPDASVMLRLTAKVSFQEAVQLLSQSSAAMPKSLQHLIRAFDLTASEARAAFEKEAMVVEPRA